MNVSTTTVVVALVSGAAGAILGKWLEGYFQRERDFRTWNLEAAADYTTGLNRALLALSACHSTMLRYGIARADGNLETRDPTTNEIRPEIATSLHYVHENINEAHSRLGRVHILFGDRSPTGRAAGQALEELRRAENAIDDWPVPDLPTYRTAFATAHEAHEEFNAAALRIIKRPPWYKRLRSRAAARRTGAQDRKA